jgi:plastocyanin
VKHAALALFACLLLAVAGCGSDDEPEGGGGSTAPEPATTSPSAADGGSASVKNTIKSFAYDPDPATVKAGGTITWTNEDSAAHNVIFEDKSVESIDNLDQGESGKVTFDKAGTYPYVCSYHSGMEGTVEVQ